MDQEPLWLSIGIVIIADSVTQQLRWMPKQLKRMNKKWDLKEKPCKQKEELKRKKQPIKPQLEKERKTQKKQGKRNDVS